MNKRKSLIFIAILAVCASICTLLASCDCDGVSQSETSGHHIHVYQGEFFEEPTCTTGGSKQTKCRICGKTLETEEVPALGHDIVSYEAKASTCTEVGWDAYEACTRCDYTTYVEIPAIGHDTVSHEAKAATCTEIGWDAYEACTRCDYTTYVEIPAIGHDTVLHEGQAVTCTEMGWNAYETCTRCDYTTYEEISALGHDIVSHEAKAATCTEMGWNAYEACTRCDYTTYEEIPAFGHNYVDGICTICEQAEPIYIRIDDDHILFGSYPQTEVTESGLTSALNSAAGTLPTKDNSGDWTSYGYYSDGTAQNFMWYIDIPYNRGTYRGVYFTQYRPNQTTDPGSAAKSYQDDNGYEVNTVYWFKWEPIKWRILAESDGTAILLCDMIIDSQAYQNTYVYDTAAFLNYNNSTGTPEGIYANDYGYSTIRAWLNDTFYSTAFNTLQKAVIEAVEINNSEDNIWLLSEQEVRSEEYGFSSGAENSSTRYKNITAYARIQGAYSENDDNGYWWLRSPYSGFSSSAKSVDYNGAANYRGVVNNTRSGVVPALKIKLEVA